MKSIRLANAEWEPRLDSYTKVVPFETYGRTKYQVVRFEPNTKIDDHYHILTQEIFVTTKGEGTLWLNNMAYALIPGMVYLIESGDVHAISAYEDGLEIHIFKPFEADEDIYWGSPCDE